MKNGVVGDLITTKESVNDLVPGSESLIAFEWILPDEISGLSVYAVSTETGLTGEFTSTSDALKVSPAYEISGVELYQGDDGFYASMSVKKHRKYCFKRGRHR